jgi:hypothetical protein
MKEWTIQIALVCLVCLYTWAAVQAIQGSEKTPAKFTDAQLLKAEKHKSAVLQYQLAKQAIDARGKELQDEETALNHELCGDTAFDYGTSACTVKAEKPVEKK